MTAAPDTDIEPTFFPATGENKPDFDAIDVSSAAFWKLTMEEREESFAILRRERPVSWQRPVEDAVTPDPDDPGYWVVTTQALINEVSRRNDVYISGQGVLFDMLPPMFLEMSQSFLAMDDPRHGKLRRLVASAFTPKRVRRMEEQIAGIAKRCVDDIADKTFIDFVPDFAALIPLITFCEIFGVPEEDREMVGKAAADVVAWTDPETLGDRAADEVQIEACVNLHDIAERMIEERRKNPTDDLMTSLVQAEIDGEHLDELQIGAFFVLMAVAGTDTTKHTASYAVMGFTEFPEQKAWLMEDFDNRIDGAIEEFVRYGSPVMNFRRTAAVETELGGQRIMPGDKVVLMYSSGNRDETVFDRPDYMDLSRNPNPHVGFGGGGVHYCLGNQLAKMMLRHEFKELLFRIPDFKASNPKFLGANFMRAATHLDFEMTPEHKES